MDSFSLKNLFLEFFFFFKGKGRGRGSFFIKLRDLKQFLPSKHRYFAPFKKISS